MAEKKINKCLNFAKGVACILVVFIHCQFPPPVGRYVISIARAAVPLFFMVSGYFCFYGDRQRLFERLPQKIRHIARLSIGAVVLYIVWDLVKLLLTQSSFYAWTGKFTVDWLFQFLIINNTDAINTALWFFFALLYCYGLYYVINKLNLLGVFYRLIPILFVAFYVLLHAADLFGKAVPTCFYRNAYLEGLPFFLLGNLLFKHKERVKRLGVKFALPFTVAGAIGSIVEQSVYARWTPCLYYTSILLVVGAFMLCIVYDDREISSPFEKLGGKYSLYVYLFHPMFFALLGMIELNSEVWRYLMPFAVLLLSIIGSVLYVKIKENKRQRM